VRRVLALALALLGAGLVPASASARTDLAGFVDPMIGTAAPGFVVPGAVVPYGMVQNSPDTTGPFAYSGYLWTDPVIRGFSLVHLSGPGVKKAGDVPFTPWVGPLPPSSDPNLYASAFDRATEAASPGSYRVRLASGTKVELSASTRGAIQRYTFPPSPQSNVLLDIVRSAEGVAGRDGHVDLDPATNSISGWTAGRYKVFFAGRFDRPWTAAAPWGSGDKGRAFTFDTTAARAVTLRVAVSFVDAEGARRNLDAEAPDFDLAAMRARARSAWNEALAAIVVRGGTVADKQVFYTSLYHAQLHPNVFEDVDRRYMGFDRQVHVATDHVHYGNFSSWDTYKAQNQLLATIAPERYRDMVLSLLDAYRESGKLPRWGEQYFDAAHMSGDPAIPMIADAVCRGLLDDRPVERAALLDAAVDLVDRRPAELGALGYLPDRPGTTLEYGGADFALALLADREGAGSLAAAALDRSRNWRNVLEPSTGWVRPRNADGSWAEPFQPTDETGFQEGNSWQYSWLAPHDSAALFAAMGGESVASDRLDQLLAAPAEAQTRATFFGIVYRAPQYAPGNEHDIQIPWMLPYLGQQWKLADELRNVQHVFRPTVDGLPGNDDLGSLSAWQVWSALGLGPVIPGSPFLVVGSPLFSGASIRLGGAADAPRFTVSAPGASLAQRYVQSASLNGAPLTASWLWASALRGGGSLQLDLGVTPNQAYGAAVSDRPPSSPAGVGALGDYGCRRAGG
jgi:predicted alpha-1,2-mannosidase